MNNNIKLPSLKLDIGLPSHSGGPGKGPQEYTIESILQMGP